MSLQRAVKLTANFERNLAEVEAFLLQAEAPRAFEGLLDELLDEVIPNLERFPDMGRLLLERPGQSVEVVIGIERLATQLGLISSELAIREYVMRRCLLLYAQIEETLYLLSIRHQRQLSFDFKSLWAGT